MNSNPWNVMVPRASCHCYAFDLYLKEFFGPNTFQQREALYRQTIVCKLKLNTYISTQMSESKFNERYGENVQVIIGGWGFEICLERRGCRSICWMTIKPPK